MTAWIYREVEFPDYDQILCYGSGQIFICQLVESKWGNFYHSTDWGHGEFQDMPEWTHWMPLPTAPDISDKEDHESPSTPPQEEVHEL